MRQSACAWLSIPSSIIKETFKIAIILKPSFTIISVNNKLQYLMSQEVNGIVFYDESVVHQYKMVTL